ncbi:MAG: mannose-1-phosphate guanylyltransferase [Prevotellaceae bacterium]|nr:mannose-1-phosphate guanylyltransferase [Prevotellaceae bacterium]
MQKNSYCIIMAGGIGSRFWPLSRKSKPKQFLDILGTGKTFIRQTFERFANIIPVENFLVVTGVDYKQLVLEQIPELAENQILCEPIRRNTAPCIAYATYKLLQKNPDATVVVTPSDHLIMNETGFLEVIINSLNFARNHAALVTIGLKPLRPETGYGYIQVNREEKELCSGAICKVKTFTEKPDMETARVFVESGEFYWNSGIFIWNLQSIKQALEENIPDISAIFAAGVNTYDTSEEENFIADAYSQCRNISIDYGVMEKSQNVFVFGADFGWSDVGTWDSLFHLLQKDEHGNAVIGENVFLRDVNNCMVNIANNKLLLISDIHDFLIVDTDDVLLICPRNDEERIKLLIADVIIEKGPRLA